MPKGKPGDACGTDGGKCATGLCVDGVCCGSNCGGSRYSTVAHERTLYVGIPMVVLGGAAVVRAAWTDPSTTGTSGQKVSAARIRDNLLYLKTQVDSAVARLGKTAPIQTQVVSNTATAGTRMARTAGAAVGFRLRPAAPTTCS